MGNYPQIDIFLQKKKSKIRNFLKLEFPDILAAFNKIWLSW